MASNLTKSESEKNPLRIFLVAALILGTLYIIDFSLFLRSNSLNTLLSQKANGLTGFLLVIAFIISYYRKLIYAWWIPFLFLPAVSLIRGLLYEDESEWWVSIGGYLLWFVFVGSYLGLRYQSYKNYIKRDKSYDLYELDTEKEIQSYEGDQNPLSIIFGASIIWAAFNIFVLIKTIDSKGPGILMHENANKFVELLLCIAFMVSYVRKSILAWWVAVFFGPIASLVYAFFHSDTVKLYNLIICIVFELVILFAYLLPKYKPYRNYIKSNFA